MGEQDVEGRPTRITVSRDTLRAELAEMELRLRVYFDEQLRRKADAAPLTELILRVDALDRGDFTDVHRRALTDFIEDRLAKRTDRGWTARERVLGVVVALVTVATFLLSLYATASVHGVEPSPPTTPSAQTGGRS